jgi:hypothetical protein
MTVKKFYSLIQNKDGMSELMDMVSGNAALISFLKSDPTGLGIPLPSPERMLLARQLALYVKPDNCSLTNIVKGKWHIYWLRCCLREECNYYFAIFKELGINREGDVEAIVKNNYLWSVVNSEEGMKFYKQTIAEWFLKRYNGKKARSVLKTIKCMKWFSKIKFYYPRLFVAILIGFLPLITQKDMWLMPLNLSEVSIVFIGCVLLGLCYFYLSYECNKIINDIKEAKKRALYPCLKGLFISLFFSVVICLSIGPAMLCDRVENITGINYFLTLLELGKYFWKDIMLFALLALFIGIFIQLLWEEKTVTEPL